MKRTMSIRLIVLSVLMLFFASMLFLSFRSDNIVCYFPDIFPKKMHIKRTQRHGSYIFLAQDKDAPVTDSSDYIHYWNTTYISPLYLLKTERNDTLYVYGSIIEIHCPHYNVRKLLSFDSLSRYSPRYELKEESGILHEIHIDSSGERRTYRAVFDNSTGMMVKDSVPQYKRAFF